MLTLLVGVVGAVVLSTAAGARRSDTALARFNVSSRSADVQLQVASIATPAQDARAWSGARRRVVRGPCVRSSSLFLALRTSVVAAAADARFAAVVDRARVVAGRAANPAAVDEITIGEGLAAKLHLGVGGHLDVLSYSVAQVQAAFDRQRGTSPGRREVLGCGCGSSGSCADRWTLAIRARRADRWSRPPRSCGTTRTGSETSAPCFGSGPAMVKPMSTGWWHRRRPIFAHAAFFNAMSASQL